MRGLLNRASYLTFIFINSFLFLGAQNNSFVIINELSQKFKFNNKQSENLYLVGEFKELYVDTFSFEIIIPNALLIKELYCLLDAIGETPKLEICDKVFGPFNIHNIYYFYSDLIKIAAYVGKLEFDRIDSQEIYLPDLGIGIDQYYRLYSEPTKHKYIVYLSMHLSVESSISSHGPVTTILNVYKLTDHYDLSNLLSWGAAYIENLEVYTHVYNSLIRVK